MDQLTQWRIEALVRAHAMRDMRDEGASIETNARYFSYHPASVMALIEWHESLYAVAPASDLLA